MQYVHVDPDGNVTEREITQEAAILQIGERVMIGFPLVQRYVEGLDGSTTSVNYFQSDVTGRIWALYY